MWLKCIHNAEQLLKGNVFKPIALIENSVDVIWSLVDIYQGLYKVLKPDWANQMLV